MQIELPRLRHVAPSIYTGKDYLNESASEKNDSHYFRSQLNCDGEISLDKKEKNIGFFYLHSEMSFQPQKNFPLTLLRIGIRSFRRVKKRGTIEMTRLVPFD